jgi:hypothetical protein
VDYERDLQGYAPALGVVKDFIVELQALSGLADDKIGIYTNYYFWKERTPADPADLAWYGKYHLWLAWYSSNPSYVSVPSPWNLVPTEPIIWQDGTPAIGLAAGVESKEIDHNKLNGDSSALKDIFGSASIVPPAYSQPYAGFDEYIEIVNGERCHVSVIDLSDKKVRVSHFNGNLGYVSRVAMGANVQAVFNGEDYFKDALIKYYPKHTTYTDGSAYIWTSSEAAYYLNVSRTNEIHADSSRYPIEFWNTTSFIRPLIVNGQVAPDIVNNPTKIEYTEVHACSALGYTKNGKLIQVVAEGKVNPQTGVPYRGVTIPQLCNLLLKYGTVFAGQHGGGGDSGKAIKGVMVNEPSDPTERAVVQVIEILGKGDNIMYGTAKEKLGNTSTIREEPSRYGKDTGRRIYPYATIEFASTVPVVVKGTADNPNDIWFKLPDGAFVNYILSGTNYYTIITSPTPDEPAPEDKIEIYVNGTLKYTITGKLVVS